MTLRKQVLYKQNRAHALVNSLIRAVCAKPENEKDRQKSQKIAGCQDVPLLAKELLTTDD